MSEVSAEVIVPAIDEVQRKFLQEIRAWKGVATPQELRIPADRKQDRARQRSRRQGLVTFEGGYWRLTELGEAALTQ